MDHIYLDHASTTPVGKSVLESMLPYFSACFGNASSIHGTGREARKAVENARRQVQAVLHARSAQEIYFTSGGTESDNWAIKGMAFSGRGRHIVTTSIEHHAVLRPCQWLEKQGFSVTYLPVDGEGRVSPRAVAEALREDTALVSVMLANNEIGTLEPVREIAQLAHERGIPVHTDAVQAVGSIPVDVEWLGVDLLSLSAHKFYGPKGIGALYVRSGTRMERLMQGGEQERRMRAGTENLPGIVGLGTAITEAAEGLEAQAEHLTSLRRKLLEGLRAGIPGVLLNGPEEDRLPGNLNVSFPGVQGEAVLLRLDLAGVAASAGSACTAGSLDPSHVLTAIGRDRDTAHASLRLTLGKENTESEVEEVLRLLPAIVKDLREMRL